MACPIRYRDALLAIAALLAVAGDARADAAGDATRLELADYFYTHRQYYRAIGAYEELRLFTADPALAARAGVRIALSYHHGRQVDDAVAAYDRVLAAGLDPDTAGLVRIARALARVDPDTASRTPLADAIADLAPLARAGGAGDPPLATYHLARLRLAGADPTAARTLVGRCRERPDPACRLVPRLETALALPGPRRRIPLLAAALSAVAPGLGSLYNGHRVDGIYYFALTAGAAFVAWDVHDPAAGATDQKTSFYLMSSIAAVFYLSSIVQGWLGTKRFNELEALAHRRAVLRATDVPLPLDP
jgi:hypothetical protein